MRKILFIFLCMFVCLNSCKSDADREKEAMEEFEKEAKARAVAEYEEWRKIRNLVDKATGLTTTSKDERRLSYVKLMQIFPEIEEMEDLYNSIDDGDFYEQRDDLLFKIKKIKGWEDIE